MVQLCLSCTRTHITLFSILWREIAGYRALSHIHWGKGCGTYNIATTPCSDTFPFSAFTVLLENGGRRNAPRFSPGQEQKSPSNEINFPLPHSSSGSGFGGKLSGQTAGGRSILTSTARCLKFIVYQPLLPFRAVYGTLEELHESIGNNNYWKIFIQHSTFI